MLSTKRCLIVLVVLGLVGLNLGNAQATTLIQSQVCSSPPPLTISSPSDQTTTTASSMTVTGQAETGATVSILDNGTVIAADTVPQTGIYSVDGLLDMGANRLQVKMSDNCGATLSSNSLTVLRVPLPAVAAQPAASDSSLVDKLLAPVKQVIRAVSWHHLATSPSPVTTTPVTSGTAAGTGQPVKTLTITANEVISPPVRRAVSVKTAVIAVGGGATAVAVYAWIGGKLSISKIILWFK